MPSSSPPAARRRRAPLPERAADPIIELSRRLDDSGCAFGRVSAARLEHLARAYERLEAKLNAVLLAVAGTFLSTLASLLLSSLRGGVH